MKLYKYTHAELIEAIARSTSLRQTLIYLNVSPFGGNYVVLKKAISHFELDTSHFTGRAWNKGEKLPARKLVEAYLKQGSTVSSYRLKNRLLREGILEAVCAICTNATWLNRPIPLELDHIDGDNTNNQLDNLRLLCPNCHAFTPTYRSKNRKDA